MAGITTFSYERNVVQTDTITTTGIYDITALGGAGGDDIPFLAQTTTLYLGGAGAQVGGEFDLQAGEVLQIVVGGVGHYGISFDRPTGSFGGGGGGSSYVGVEHIQGPLVLAGGGGGAGTHGSGYGGSLTSAGGMSGGSNFGVTGGSGGGGGQYGGFVGGLFLPPGVGSGGGAGGAGIQQDGYGSSIGNPTGGSDNGAGGNGPVHNGTRYYGSGGFGFTGGGGGGRGGFNGVYSGGGGGGGGFSGGAGGYSGLPGNTYGYYALGGGGGGSYVSSQATDLLTPTDTEISDSNGEVTIELVCYLRGTHILTPIGERFIEDLRIGDRVVTRFGGIQAIRWIGRQSYNRRFIGPAALPVCIRAGALGKHLPTRDLYISPGHSMLIKDQLILAEALVNGLTITQDWAPNEIHYYQVELDSHDCMIAEGTWSETYADGPGLRARFHNAAEFEAIYPDRPPPDALRLCLPRPERGPLLDAALRPLLARFDPLTPGPLRGWIDIVEAPWRITGWAQDETHTELPVLLEILIEDRLIGTVLACDLRSDLMKAGIGKGRCSFDLTSPVRLRPEMLGKLRIRRASDQAELPMNDHCLGLIAKTQGEPQLARVRLVA